MTGDRPPGMRFSDALGWYWPSDETILNLRSTTQEPQGKMKASPTNQGAIMNASKALEKAIDAGIKAEDLYEYANVDLLHRDHVRKFLKAAIAEYLRQMTPHVMGREQPRA